MINEMRILCDACQRATYFPIHCQKTCKFYCPWCVAKIGHEPPFTEKELKKISILHKR